MRKAMIVLACLASTSALATESPRADGQAVSSPRIAGDTVRMAQRGCWYAIYYCGQGRSQAQVWANHNRGRVIDTSSDEFPNFAPGHYCVVDGPMDQGSAQSAAARMRRSAPTAYAKSAC